MLYTDLGYRHKSTATRGKSAPTPGAKTVLPPSQDVGMGYHPLGARLVQQNRLNSKLFTKQLWLSAFDKSVMTRYRTHTLLLTTPEFGSSNLNHSTITGHKLCSPNKRNASYQR